MAYSSNDENFCPQNPSLPLKIVADTEKFCLCLSTFSIFKIQVQKILKYVLSKIINSSQASINKLILVKNNYYEYLRSLSPAVSDPLQPHEL